MTVGSLFAGIGGFDLAAERVGFEVKWQVEIDPFCRRVLEKHWPRVRRCEDVREVHGKGAMCSGCVGTRGCGNVLEAVDIIVGGDPCQRNSNAWRHGGGSASPAFQFLRIVDEIRPSIVVRENPSTVRADAPWPWHRFRNGLECLGYTVLPFRLRACCVGADHARDRLFLLATLQDANSARLERAERRIVAHQDKRRYDANPTGPDRWYATPRICRSVDGIPNRVDRLRGLGNAIVPQVAEWIFQRIKEVENE